MRPEAGWTKPTRQRQAKRCCTTATGRCPFGAQTRRRSGLRPMRCSSVAHSSTVACGMGGGYRADERADFFLNVGLLRGVGQGVARPRRLPALLEPLQVLPAALHLPPDGRACAAIQSATARQRPVLRPVGRRPGQRLPQLLLLLGREHARGAPRGRVLPVDHARRPFGVVALGDLPDPGARVAGALGDVLGQLPAGQQPEDLPPRAFVRLVRRPVALLEVVDAQVRRQVDASHGPILSGPSRKPYHSPAKRPCPSPAAMTR